MLCPRCQHELPVPQRNEVAQAVCPHCGAALSFSPLHTKTALLLSFAATLVIAGALGVKAWAAILWIPLLVITFIVMSIVVMVIAPPRLRVLTASDLATTKIEPWRRNLRFFLILWFALTFYLVTYGFVIGWCAYLLGHSPQDVREATDMFSMPLAFVNSAFLIRPTSSFAAVFGIVFANCFFYAAVLLAIVRIVQNRLHQPVTQIGIFHPRKDQQDDEEL